MLSVKTNIFIRTRSAWCKFFGLFTLFVVGPGRTVTKDDENDVWPTCTYIFSFGFGFGFTFKIRLLRFASNLHHVGTHRPCWLTCPLRFAWYRTVWPPEAFKVKIVKQRTTHICSKFTPQVTRPCWLTWPWRFEWHRTVWSPKRLSAWPSAPVL